MAGRSAGSKDQGGEGMWNRGHEIDRGTGGRFLVCLALLVLGLPVQAMSRHELNRVSLRYPDGWIMEANDRGQILLTGTADEEVALWPLFSPRRMTARTASALLLRMVRHNLPDFHWRKPRGAGKGVVCVASTSGDTHAVAILSWRATARGTAMTYYLVVAPVTRFRQEAKRFSEILASLRLRGHGRARGQVRRHGGHPPHVRYRRWRDPMEGMFAMEVPRHWRVEGGTARASAIDVRPWIRVTSPDGRIEIFRGNAEIPTFTEPTPIGIMNGSVEGTWYDPGYGTRMFVLRYRPGVAFLDYFLPQWAAGCRIRSRRDRQDVAEAEARIRARWGLPVQQQDDAGEADLDCRGSHGHRLGYAFVQTRRFQGYGVSLWQVPRFLGYLAPAGKEAQARAILAHMIRTTWINPDWVRSQTQTTGNVSAAVQDTANYLSRVIGGAYANTQAAQARVAEAGARARREVERVQDARTGQVYEIQSGNDYDWIDAQGHILGTRTDANPNGLQFERMIRLDQ